MRDQENPGWFEKSGKLPSLPKAALELLETFKASEPDPKRVIRAIESDAALCARTLRLANSPYYSRGKSVSGASSALMVLGLSQARAVALAAAVASLGAQARGLDVRRFAMLSALASMGAGALAERVGVHPSQARAAGLLKPIGMVLMRQARPKELMELDERMDAFCAQRIGEEQELWGVGWERLSLRLAERWGLPEEILSLMGDQGVGGALGSLAVRAALRQMAPAECQAEFDQEQSLPRWAAALNVETPWAWEIPTVEQAKASFGDLVS